MRNSRSYQLVSEHSILSARRKNGDAAGAPRTRSQRLKEFGERVRQIGATREPYRHHDANTTTPDFKVYDRGRGETEIVNSRKQSREDEIHEKLEEMAEILRSYLSNVTVKSSKPEEGETEESKKENEGIRGSSGVPFDVIAKPEGAKWNNDDQGPPSETQDVEATTAQERPEETMLEESSPEEEMSPEDSPATATDGGTMLTEAWPPNRLVASFLSISTKEGDAQSGDEEEAQPEETSPEAPLGESSPEEEDDGVTVRIGETVCDSEVLLSLCNVKCDGFGKEKEASVGWISRKMDLRFNPLGQAQLAVSKSDLIVKSAQTLIFTPTKFIINEMLQVKREMGQKKEGIIFNSRAGLANTLDPPNTLLVAENKAFDPGDSFSIFGIAPSSCFKLWDPGGRLLMVCLWCLHLEDKVNV